MKYIGICIIVDGRKRGDSKRNRKKHNNQASARVAAYSAVLKRLPAAEINGSISAKA